MTDIFTIGMVLTAVDRASNTFRGLSNNAITELGKIQKKLRETGESLTQFGIAAAGAGMMTLGALGKVVENFAEFEDAALRMEIAFSTLTGVDKHFEAIKKLTIELGNALPGTTEDFVKLATAMKEAGISAEIIAKGGLKAAAYLKVLFQENDPTVVGEIIAGAMHGLNLQAEHLEKFADMIQRAHFAFGVNLQTIQYALPYISRAYGAINPQGGLEAANNMIMLIGLQKQAGLGASEIGTSIGSFYSEIARKTEQIKKGNLRGFALKEAAEIFEKYKMKFEFWNSKGDYIGDEAVFRQIWALKKLGATQQEVFQVGHGIAGEVGGSLFVNLFKEGEEGWKKAKEAMQNQSDLNKKMEILLDSLTNVWESFMGTLKNVTVIMGAAMAPTLKIIFDWTNKVASGIQTFMAEQEKGNTILWKFIQVIMLSTGGIAAVVTLLGGLALALGAIFRMSSYAIGGLQGFIKFLQVGIPWIKMHQAEILRLAGIQKLMNYISYHGGFWQAMQFWLLSTKYKILEAVTALKLWTAEQWAATRASWLSVSGIRSLASGFSVTLLSGLKAAVAGIRAFSVALLTTPVGWLGLAVAAAALLVYKYWGPISGFFRGLWAGIKEGLKGLEPAWDVFKKVAVIFAPLIWPLKLIYTLIKALIKPVEDTGHAAENMGIRVGRAIGNVIKWVALLPYKMVTALADAAKSLFNAGANLINQLWNGIKSVASKPIAAVKEVAQKIRNLLPFSPAKEGPLATLNQVRLMETITENIKAAPLVSAMKNALAAPFKGGGLSPAAAGGVAAGKGFGGGINLTFHFTLPKGTEAETVQRIVKTSGLEVEKVMRRKYSI